MTSVPFAARPLRPSERFRILQRDGFRCQYCGAAAPDVELHVDHFVPLSAGGGNETSNLVTACRTCNAGKGVRLLGGADSYTESRGFRLLVLALRLGIPAGEIMEGWEEIEDAALLIENLETLIDLTMQFREVH